MNSIDLTDTEGNTFNAKVLFMHHSDDFNKDYIVYLIDNELYSSSYEIVDNQIVINSELSDEEYDMLG